MLDLFKSLVLLMKLERIRIDNNVFRLHYKVTVCILLCFSLLLTSKQYFGDPIDCITKSAVPKKALDTYCWIFSTFTVKKHLHGDVQQGAAHPGVAPHMEHADQVIHHKYYQWVCFVMCFQAILFYIPRCVWKSMEGGLVRMLAYDILERPLTNDKWTDKRQVMVDYLTETHLHTNNLYAAKFAIAEIMNFVNVVGQIFFINLFLGHQFLDYGPFIVWNFHGLEDPMSHVFPKVTKCTFRDFGPSGDIQVNDAICVLPLNIVNEKFYVFLWFWFGVLATVSCLALLYRLALLDRRVRAEVLWSKAKLMDRTKIELIVEAGRYGDWFLLTQLANNMNPVMFQELLESMAERFAEHKKRDEAAAGSRVALSHSVRLGEDFGEAFEGAGSVTKTASREQHTGPVSTAASVDGGTDLIGLTIGDPRQVTYL